MRTFLLLAGCAATPVMSRPPVIFSDRPPARSYQVVGQLDQVVERSDWLPEVIDRLRDEGKRRGCDAVLVKSGWVLDGLMTAEAKHPIWSTTGIRPPRTFGIHADCVKF